MTARSAAVAAQAGTGLVLLTLASGQFLMTLDSSVMNVSIATVAKDLGTAWRRPGSRRPRWSRPKGARGRTGW